MLLPLLLLGRNAGTTAFVTQPPMQLVDSTRSRIRQPTPITTLLSISRPQPDESRTPNPLFIGSSLYAQQPSKDISTGVGQYKEKESDKLGQGNNSGNGRRRWRKQSQLEVSIQTLQMLLNQKKRPLLRQDILQRYPFMPASLVDSCIDVVALALGKIAPSNVKQVLLEPGQIRPGLKERIVVLALQQDMIQNIPLVSNEDKEKVLNAVVDKALDRLLEDVDWILLSPPERIQILQNEIDVICATEMTKRQVWMLYLGRSFQKLKQRLTTIRRPPQVVAVAVATLVVVAATVRLRTGTFSSITTPMPGLITYFWNNIVLVSLYSIKVGILQFGSMIQSTGIWQSLSSCIGAY